MADFTGDLTPIIDFVGVTLRDAKDQESLELWRQAEFDYGRSPDRMGPDDFYLRVGLRAGAYRRLGAAADRKAFEEKVKEIAEPVINGYEDVWMKNVHVYPIPEADDSWRGGVARPIQASVDDASRIWSEGHFRLFLSHSSTDKEFGAKLKANLERVRIDAFIAHETIEPDLPWQEEIKLGLASCHALMFIATEASNQSWWCQQEVGWALGRGIAVTSYMLEKEPVGFANALQGWKVPKHDLHEVRKRLLSKFAKDDRTEPAMREPLVQLTQASRTAAQIDYTLDYVELLKSLSQGDLERIHNVLSQPFVSKSKPLKERIQATLSNFGFTPPAPVVVSADEYDPFADE